MLSQVSGRSKAAMARVCSVCPSGRHSEVFSILAGNDWLSLGEMWMLQQSDQSSWGAVEEKGGLPVAFCRACPASLSTSQREMLLDILLAGRHVDSDPIEEAPTLIDSPKTGLSEIFKCEDFISRLGGHAISLSKCSAGLVLQCASLSYVKSQDSNSWQYYLFLERSGQFELVCGAVRSGVGSSDVHVLLREGRPEVQSRGDRWRRIIALGMTCACTCNPLLLGHMMSLRNTSSEETLDLEKL